MCKCLCVCACVLYTYIYIYIYVYIYIYIYLYIKGTVHFKQKQARADHITEHNVLRTWSSPIDLEIVRGSIVASDV